MREINDAAIATIAAHDKQKPYTPKVLLVKRDLKMLYHALELE